MSLIPKAARLLLSLDARLIAASHLSCVGRAAREDVTVDYAVALKFRIWPPYRIEFLPYTPIHSLPPPSSYLTPFELAHLGLYDERS